MIKFASMVLVSTIAVFTAGSQAKACGGGGCAMGGGGSAVAAKAGGSSTMMMGQGERRSYRRYTYESPGSSMMRGSRSSEGGASNATRKVLGK
jgi:hypothetical protein